MTESHSFRIGITGGIGSGKSFVSRLLTERHGIPVYDCDSRAKAIMTQDDCIRRQIETVVGTGYTRQTLAQYVFASPQNAARINAIVHPAVKADFLRWAERQDCCTVAIESAILIEAGFTDVVDCLVLVTAPLELRIQRAMHRDSASRTDVERRIALQMTDQQRMQYADIIVKNDGDELDLAPFVTLITKPER